MKKFIKIILGIVIILVLIIGSASFLITRGLDSGKDMIIKHIDTSQFENGAYEGKYDGGRWSNEVSVVLEDGKITEINVVKSVLVEKQEVTRELINNVKEKQDTVVDVVSGATVTSKAYLKAIENAFVK